MEMQSIGKFLIIGGVLLIIIGGVFFLLGRFIGRVPGDIVVQKGNFTFYFPVVTCIIISIVLSLFGWFFRR